MKEEKYSFNKLPEEFYYEFFSEGPKGTIKKVVRYRLIQEHPSRIYNIGFGDWNEERVWRYYHQNFYLLFLFVF